MTKAVLGSLFLLAGVQSMTAQVSTSDKNVYSVVDNAETEVICTSPTDAVCCEKRTVTVLSEQGKEAANFYSSYNEKYSSLRKFSGTVTDASGKVIAKIKRSDLLRTEYSPDLASDTYRYYYNYAPSQYPFTITYEWEEKYTDGLIGFPVFLPQEAYNQAVKQASYSLQTPADLPCRYQAVNCQANISQQKTADGKLITRAVLANLPPLISEPFSPGMNNLLPRVYFVPESFTYGKTTGRMDSWKNYGKWQYGLLEGRDKLPKAFVEKLKSLTVNCQTDREKVQIVYDYLAATTRYVSIQLGIGGLQPTPASDVCRIGFGDCKALSNYTRAMLAALGIPSYYTIISTDNERFLPNFASANQANHVILQVPLPNDTLWLECTNPKLPLGYVHHAIAGHDALLIKPEGGELCRLPIYADSLCTQVNKAVVSLQADGKALVNVCQQSRLFQYEDSWPLTTLAVNEQKDYLRSNISLVQAEVENVRCEEHRQASPSLDILYDIRSNRYGTQTGKRMFLPANIFHSRFYAGGENTERTHDILIAYGYQDIDSIQIQLPEGYTVESLPKPVQAESAFGSFSSSVRMEGTKLLVVHRLFMRRGKHPKDGYASLVDFRKKIAQQYQSKIIIKK